MKRFIVEVTYQTEETIEVEAETEEEAEQLAMDQIGIDYDDTCGIYAEEVE